MDEEDKNEDYDEEEEMEGKKRDETHMIHFEIQGIKLFQVRIKLIALG